MNLSRNGSPELGNAVFLDHVNFPVTDHRLATLFFIEGLGFTRDPYRNVGTANMWVNVGTQQFHLPIGRPLPFSGEVAIAVPDLAELAGRLGAIAGGLEGSEFSCAEDGECLRIVDPWGRRLRAYRAGALPGRNPLALPYVEFWVASGAAAGIADFYRRVIGAPAELSEEGGEPTAHVFVGPHQTLRYREKRDAEPSGHVLHVCLYLTHFWEIYAAMGELGILYEEVANEQFRFCDIPPPQGASQTEGSNGSLYSIEHEMRSVYHLDYRRPLVNRIAMANEPGYVAPR